MTRHIYGQCMFLVWMLTRLRLALLWWRMARASALDPRRVAWTLQYAHLTRTLRRAYRLALRS